MNTRVELSDDYVLELMRMRAGLPPKDRYLSQCFGALMAMLAANGDHRSVPQVLENLYTLHARHELFADDGK